MRNTSTYFTIKPIKFGFIGLLTLGCALSQAQSYTISTIAGNDTAGYNGDGIAATAAKLNNPSEVEVDDSGNIYIGDSFNHRIRKVDPSGIIHTIAGTGAGGYNGDGILATAAKLDYPYEIMIDAGNVYVADWGNNRIRMINSHDTISTIAGTGVGGYNNDSIAATNAELNLPSGIATDYLGNLYITDDNNNRIRMINSHDTIFTIAGTGYDAGHGYPGEGGYTGDGFAATAAEFHWPSDIKADASGNLYIVDQVNQVIRMINTSGTISTVAGNGYGAGTATGGFSGDDSAATAAELNSPTGVAIDGQGNIFIADNANNRIRMVSTGGIISTIAGTGTAGYSGDGGAADSAEIYNPVRLTVDPMGNIYFADAGNNVIRKLTPVTTGVNKVTSASQSLHIYPNPSSGVFILQIHPDSHRGEELIMKNIMVYNVLGQQVYSQLNIHNSTFNIDLGSQPNGVYLYKITKADGALIGTGKLVVEK